MITDTSQITDLDYLRLRAIAKTSDRCDFCLWLVPTDGRPMIWCVRRGGLVWSEEETRKVDAPPIIERLGLLPELDAKAMKLNKAHLMKLEGAWQEYLTWRKANASC